MEKKAGEQKKRERASVPFFAKISYLPPKIRLPNRDPMGL